MTDTATEAKTYTDGAIVWHEYVCGDVPAAEKFYGELLGWKITPMPMAGGPDYRMIMVGESMQGGFWPMEGANPGWMAYISVPDLDAAAKRITEAGGQLIKGPEDIPNVGRFAIGADPQGIGFTLFRSATGDPPGDAMPNPNEFCWDDLFTSDFAGAKAFYGKVVGWGAKVVEGMDDAEAFTMGELMEASLAKPGAGVSPGWTPHIFTPDLAAAVAKAKSLGATVVQDVASIPFGSYAVLKDPLGGQFGLFAPNMEG
jgi:predicted enzyme related to lactoylglutathione lyase